LPQDHDKPPQEPAPQQPPAHPAPPVRAFAQGTGVLLQVAGMILFLHSCCICSAAVQWDKPPTRGQTQRQLDELARDDRQQDVLLTIRRSLDEPGKAGRTLTVVLTTVGGLALAVFGLGLQSDKPRAAWGAVIAAMAWLLALLGTGVLLWWGDSSWTMRLWHAALLLTSAVLVGFTIVALRQVRRHPPPPGLDILPPDFELPQRHRY
jgi:hypothetical protein